MNPARDLNFYSHLAKKKNNKNQKTFSYKQLKPQSIKH